MRIVRLHVPLPLAVDATVRLPVAAARHATRVLRLADGARLVLFNGDGRDYAGTLHSAGREAVDVTIDAALPARAESPLSITLVQAIARGEKMDLVVQKATELGVARIVPVETERTEVQLDAVRGAKRSEHWRAVAAAACEQSGRAVLTEIAAPLALDAACATLRNDPALKLALDPLAAALPLGEAAPGHGVIVAVGPEGGFAPRDLDALAVAGFRGWTLGPRVLRTETAGLAAIAVLQARWGDF